MREILTLSIPNRLCELPRLIEAVNTFLQSKRLSREVVEIVHIALDELVTNVIRWGYDDGQEHEVRVETTVDATEVRVVIEDDGRPFDPTSIPQPNILTAPEHRSEGGLGIHLVRTMVDKFIYKRVGEQNIVEVTVARNRLRSRSR